MCNGATYVVVGPPAMAQPDSKGGGSPLARSTEGGMGGEVCNDVTARSGDGSPAAGCAG